MQNKEGGYSTGAVLAPKTGGAMLPSPYGLLGCLSLLRLPPTYETF